MNFPIANPNLGISYKGINVNISGRNAQILTVSVLAVLLLVAVSNLAKNN